MAYALKAANTYGFKQTDFNPFSGSKAGMFSIRGNLTVPASLLPPVPDPSGPGKNMEWSDNDYSKKLRSDNDKQKYQRAISEVLAAEDVFWAWYQQHGDDTAEKYFGDTGVEPEWDILKPPGSSGNYKIIVNHPPKVTGDKALIDVSFLLYGH